MKRQLPIILNDMGLKKKRLADGIYWYGLISKSAQEQEIEQKLNENIKKSENKTIESFTRFDGKRIIIKNSSLCDMKNKTFNQMFNESVYGDLNYNLII